MGAYLLNQSQGCVRMLARVGEAALVALDTSHALQGLRGTATVACRLQDRECLLIESQGLLGLMQGGVNLRQII